MITIARSKELFDFAYHGRQLYDTIFPPGKDLRGWLDKAPPGLRINIIWRPTTGAEWMPHVPWGLIYTGGGETWRSSKSDGILGPSLPTRLFGLSPGRSVEGTRYSSKRLVRQFSLLRRGHWGRNRKRKQMAKE